MSFLGHDGTVYGIGVVEDRHDPEKLGRVRVRWLGLCLLYTSPSPRDS